MFKNKLDIYIYREWNIVNQLNRKISYLIIIMFAFLSKANAEELQTRYFHDEDEVLTINTIANQKFIPFQEPLNKGLNNGVYWIEVNMDAESDIIEIPSAHIFDVKCFIDDIEIEQSGVSVFPYFNVGKNTTAYLRVLCFKEGYIRIDTYSQEKFQLVAQKRLLKNGFYFGFAFMVVIINLFCFANFREETFALYSIFLLSLSTSIFYRDGLIWLLFQNVWLIKHLESICHFFTVFSGVGFVHIYLQHDLYFPKIKYLFIGLLSIFTFVSFSYLITEEFYWFVIEDVMAISILGFCWVTSLVLFNKHIFARIFAFAFFLILFLGFDFFTSPLLGIPNLGITANLIKIGGLVEMLTLTFATIYRIRILKKENENMKKMLYQYMGEIESLETELEKLKTGKSNTITESNLSNREVEVLSLISKGETYKEIAKQLYISVNTVKYHTKKLYEKLEISSKQEARKIALELHDSIT